MQIIIKLRRGGLKKLPKYTIVVMKKKIGIYSKYIDKIGIYYKIVDGQKNVSCIKINKVKFYKWISKGALVTKELLELLKYNNNKKC